MNSFDAAAAPVGLALSLPAGPLKETILTATYLVVIFSVIVQGATVGAAAQRFGVEGS